MPDVTLLEKESPGLDEERAPASVALWGSYMPFAGVRYYAILDEHDVAEGRNRIGAVGWRPPNATRRKHVPRLPKWSCTATSSRREVSIPS